MQREAFRDRQARDGTTSDEVGSKMIHRDEDLQSGNRQSVEDWLDIATERLCQASKQRVCQEVRDHYFASVEERVAEETPESDAIDAALEELGEPVRAGIRLRRIHLTESEAKRVEQLTTRWTRHTGILRTLQGTPSLSLLLLALMVMTLGSLHLSGFALIGLIALWYLVPTRAASVCRRPSTGIAAYALAWSLPVLYASLRLLMEALLSDALGTQFLLVSDTLGHFLKTGSVDHVWSVMADLFAGEQSDLLVFGFTSVWVYVCIRRDLRIAAKLRKRPWLDQNPRWVNAR
jgi:hypothetical protein